MACKDRGVWGFFLATVYFACHCHFYFKKRDFNSFKARSSYTFHGRVTENPHTFVCTEKNENVKRSPKPNNSFTCCKRCRLRRDKITINTICTQYILSTVTTSTIFIAITKQN